MDWMGLVKKVWNKLSLGFNKTYRGLLCEKKDGGWELSKGNAAFWLVLTHCMYVWSGKATSAVSDVVTTVTKAVDAAAAAGDTATESGLLDTLTNFIGSIGVSGGVPEQEFWLLMALLGYATVKHTKGGMTNLMNAARGK